MKPLNYHRYRMMLIGFLESPAIIKALANGNLTKIRDIALRAEYFINAGMSSFGNLSGRTHRATMLGALLFKDLPRLSGKALKSRIDNIALFLADVVYFSSLTFRNGAFGRLTKSQGAFDISTTDTFNHEFFNNISRGLVGHYKAVKYMFANNHLAIQTLLYPDLYLYDMLDHIRATGTALPKRMKLILSLETGSKAETKIDDLTIILANLDLSFTLGDKTFTLFRVSPRVSMDSKVYMYPNNLVKADVVDQQVKLAMQDRLQNDLLPSLRKVMDPAAGLSPQEQKEVIDQLIPIFFQQYIVKPAQAMTDNPRITDDVDQAVLEVYKSKFLEHAALRWAGSDEAGALSAAHPGLWGMVEDAFAKHADAHYAERVFIREATDVSMWDS